MLDTSTKCTNPTRNPAVISSGVMQIVQYEALNNTFTGGDLIVCSEPISIYALRKNPPNPIQNGAPGGITVAVITCCRLG